MWEDSKDVYQLQCASHTGGQHLNHKKCLTKMKKYGFEGQNGESTHFNTWQPLSLPYSTSKGYNKWVLLQWLIQTHILLRFVLTNLKVKGGQTKAVKWKVNVFLEWGKGKTPQPCAWVNVLSYGFTVPAPQSLLHVPFSITPLQEKHTHIYVFLYPHHLPSSPSLALTVSMAKPTSASSSTSTS